MTDRVIHITRCRECPWVKRSPQIVDYMVCGKMIRGDIEGDKIPDWCPLEKGEIDEKGKIVVPDKTGVFKKKNSFSDH